MILVATKINGRCELHVETDDGKEITMIGLTATQCIRAFEQTLDPMPTPIPCACGEQPALKTLTGAVPGHYIHCPGCGRSSVYPNATAEGACANWRQEVVEAMR